MVKLFKSFTLLILMMFSFVSTNHVGNSSKLLRCWHCSSDTVGSEDFCSSEFKEQNIPNDFLKERNLSVVRSCNSTINSEHERPVCRKTIEESNGKVVVKRYCYYTNKSDPLDHCNSGPAFGDNVQRIFCQDCLTDKCNGADARHSNDISNYLIPFSIPLVFSKISII